MSNIFPFQAYRFNKSSAALKKAVCPPYDVIGETAAKKLRADKENAIHVELPSGQASDPYAAAKRTWEGWKEEQVVKQDQSPAFYIYEQRFLVGKKSYVRTGFFCEAQVEKPGEGSILRHELTLSKPKADRLNLLRSLEANTSPIFGLFRDQKEQAKKIFHSFTKQKPQIDFKDSSGVRHRMWICASSDAVSSLQQQIKKGPILIADGHHRYETAWNYHCEKKSQASNATLIFLCPIQDKGLVVFPTHRVFKEKTALSEIQLKLEAASQLFAFKRTQNLGTPKSGSLLFTDGKKGILVSPRSPGILKKNSTGKSPALLKLPLVHLHSFLFPEKEKDDFIYTHSDKEALQLAKKSRTVVCLAPAASLAEMEAIVTAGELMPQKSTFFYPKVITGLIFRSLK